MKTQNSTQIVMVEMIFTKQRKLQNTGTQKRCIGVGL